MIRFLLSIFLLITSTLAASAQGMDPWGWDDHGGSSNFYWNPRLFAPRERQWEPSWPAPRVYREPRDDMEDQLYKFAPGSKYFKGEMEPEIVPFESGEEPGTIIVLTRERKLYFVLDKESAYEYPIAVGKEGFAWHGDMPVTKIVDWPTWTPPAAMRARQPNLPVMVKGGPNNPLGAVAIYLGTSEYRIHGTNDPRSIGKAVSSGCIRMFNEHALHLASIVQIGALVRVR